MASFWQQSPGKSVPSSAAQPSSASSWVTPQVSLVVDDSGDKDLVAFHTLCLVVPYVTLCEDTIKPSHKSREVN